MFRKLFAAVVLLVSTASVTAYSSPAYLKVYNYTDSELRVYVDGYDQGTIPVGSSPNWIPAPYGMHKVEAYRVSGSSSTAKWAELSYSYPNADVTIARYDL
ncbi:hypothetical protein JST97_03770 [bacterium]|nr:hypothetical protein [bacterium]